MSASLFPDVILASGSIYRRELLERLRIPFEVIVPDIDETPADGETPEDTALRLAREKAEAIVKSRPGAIVIGSDQVATLDDEQIGKPGTHDNALKQLMAMRGRCVIFHTALCVLDGRQTEADRRVQTASIKTAVTFRNLPQDELEAYLFAEEPYDCAGSARNEALGIVLLEKIESTDPTALTGLPLITLTTMLKNCGVSFFP